MNKKKKNVNKKHRKTKSRLKFLQLESLKKAKKKVIAQPKKEDSPIQDDKIVKDENKTAKKTTAKKTTAKKTTAKKTTVKKK